jgi:hypothetical protein
VYFLHHIWYDLSGKLIGRLIPSVPNTVARDGRCSSAQLFLPRLRRGLWRKESFVSQLYRLPLFTGVTRGMEFSEICRFGAFQSPAYVTR